MENWKVYAIVVPVSLLVGTLIGFLTRNYILKRQMEELQKKMQEPDKEQVRNMLSALGKKPSEEQVNRFISMTKNSAKKGQGNAKKTPSKKVKK